MSARCRACRVEKGDLSPSEAYVLGLIVADLEHRRRLSIEGTLCDRHAKLPHEKNEPRP